MSAPGSDTVLRRRLIDQLGGRGDLFPTALEQHYPAIFQRIALLWGAPELDSYFAELLTPERTDHAGWPETIAHELFQLSALHAGLNLGAHDAWDDQPDTRAGIRPDDWSG